jgi:dihydrofolate synthase / folylpolyglutamate synthase
MTVRSLDDWLAHAERVHPVGIDMGLARVRRIAERLDVLPPAPRNIVVAGTNGKGSTSVYLEALLLADGRSVGTTLSPHLSRFNERVRVNGEAVDDVTLCDAFETIEEARGETTLTYFEFGVLAALLVFRRARVDATVLEVGLGGRLDAVNIVDGCVSVITSIGIDHVGYLGSDRESIGREKAGILRRGVPCVYGEASIPSSIVDAAKALDVPMTRFGTDYFATASECTWSFEGRSASQPVHLTGLVTPSVALINAATALQALLLLGASAPIERLVAGASSARLPGRFERFDYRGASVIVDVAHNPHGAVFLSEQLRATRPAGRTIALAGFLQDKDAAGIVAALSTAVDEWTLVATHGARGQTAALSMEKTGLTGRAAASEEDLVDVLDGWVRRMTVHDRLIVVGCFELAQRARSILLQDTHRD